ncbi:MAG TPA: hypothetical protein VE621_01785 [Bryobacteraceae bacterium]|nr:hypothetical protein [Bryobacteraceae bacterium]
MTKAKLDANRANAKKSTGPRTTDGKARSSRNAVSHGLRSGNFVLAHEDADAFDDMLAYYHDRYCSADDIDAQFLVEQLVGAQWRLLRVQRLQTLYMDAVILGYSNEPTSDELILQNMEGRSNDVLDTLHRYELQFDRAAWRIRKQLNSAQEEERSFERSIADIDLFGPPPPVEVMMAQQRLRKQQEAARAANEPKQATPQTEPIEPEPAGELTMGKLLDQLSNEQIANTIEQLQQIERTNPFPEAEATELQLEFLQMTPEYRASFLGHFVNELNARTKPRVAAAA